ncbi:MAG TPA: alpha/beta hydrolase [Cyclobacteriaceae bacterium]|nr:alpha/beta hydrolase [Cyclobacteriaceae bacterium]
MSRLKKRRFWGAVVLALVLPPLIIFAILSFIEERNELTEEIRARAPGSFISLSKGTVHYLLAGDTSSPLLIFIHGGGVSGLEVWKKNIPYFASKHFCVLAYDLYGRGYSDRPHQTNSPLLFQMQLDELLSKLKLKKPYCIVAMSMGAIIALDYVNANSCSLHKLVLIDPAATGDFQLNGLLKIPIISSFMMTVGWYPRALENQRKEFFNEKLFDEDYAKRLSYFMDFKGYKFTMHSTWIHMLNQNRLDQFNKPAKLDMLLVYGAQDPYFNRRDCVHYQKQIPFIQVVKIDSAGHMPHYEKPDQVNKVIYSFLSGNVFSVGVPALNNQKH